MMLYFITFLLILHSLESVDISISPQGERFVKPIGSALLFTCSILDVVEEHVSIHWIDNKGEEILETSGRRFVEDDDDHTKLLYITSIDSIDEGKFTCKATIDDEELTKSLILDIFHDLKIVANETQNVILNSDALIACQVSGENNYKVSWKKDGKRLLGSRYIIDSMKGLKIEKITEADKGVYMCRADIRTLGLVRSKNINVVVHVPPRIVLNENLVEIIETHNALLKCQANGFPKPTFIFSKVDAKVALESSENVVIDEEAGTLLFSDVQHEDAGPYECTATNSAGSDTATIVLTVLVPAKIMKFSTVETFTGVEVSLQCNLRGYPRPEVIFSKSNGPDNLIDEMPDRFSSLEENDAVSLTIYSAQPDDAGVYVCSAKNSVGMDHMETQLIVKYIPIMIKESSELEYNWPTHSVNFTCEAKAYPHPTFSWVKSEGADNLYTNDTYTIFDADNLSILQVKVEEKDQGWIFGIYHCIASNDLGEVSRDFTMNRAVTPDKPMQIMLFDAQPTMITIDISPPESDGGVPVLTYLVEYKKNIELTPTHEPIIKEKEDIDLHKSEEDGADEENENEPGEHKFESNDHDAVSEEDEIHNTNDESNEDSMMSDEPSKNNLAAIDNFNSHNDETWIKVTEGEGSKVTVTDLDPETEYIFRIRAKNAVGYGLPEFFSAKTTSQNVPSMIELSSSRKCQQPFSYKASWKIPYNGGLPINTYVVKYKLSKEGLNLTTVNPKLLGWSEKQTKQTEINIDGLRPQSMYMLLVHARNSLGLSPVHEEFVFETCKDPNPIIKNTNIEVMKPELGASTNETSNKGIIIGIAILVLVILLVIIDIICCYTKKCGIIFRCLRCIRGKSENDNKSNKKTLPNAKDMEMAEEKHYLSPAKKV